MPVLCDAAAAAIRTIIIITLRRTAAVANIKRAGGAFVGAVPAGLYAHYLNVQPKWLT